MATIMQPPPTGRPPDERARTGTQPGNGAAYSPAGAPQAPADVPWPVAPPPEAPPTITAGAAVVFGAFGLVVALLFGLFFGAAYGLPSLGGAGGGAAAIASAPFSLDVVATEF
jgi:hypothetical protein